jgi:hypothetical protein
MRAQAAKAAHPSREPREGDLHGDTIPYLIQELYTTRATGLLTLTDGDIRKSLQFREGMLLFASSNQRDDRLNALLMREGVLPLKSLMKALEVMMATRDRLGEVLVKWKLMTRDEVERWVRGQVREIAYSVFPWQRGRYLFEPKDPPAETITAGDPGNHVVFEGIKRIHSWARAYEELGGLHTEFLATRDAPEVIRQLGLSKDEKHIVDMCEQPMTLEEICDDSKLKDFDVCRLIWAFLVVGALMKS